MAAENIYQLYLTNPVTSNQSLDLMYFGRSPYGVTNDAVMTFANFQAQFIAPGLAGQIGYYATNGSLLSPGNLVAGSGISIVQSGANFTISVGGGGGIVGSVQGTANQVLVNGTSGTPETGTIVLTAPQNLNTTAAFQVNTLQFNSNNGILDSNGNEMLELNPTVNAVNFLTMQNKAAGSNPGFGVAGADANIGFNFYSKGTGGFAFPSNTLANYLTIEPAAASSAPVIGVNGTDSNIGLNLQPKGTGAITLLDGNGNILVTTSTIASAANYLQIANALSGNGPVLYAAGVDANITFGITAKGTGGFTVSSTTSGNYFIFGPGQAGHPCSIVATGSDTNIGLLLQCQNTGVLSVYTTSNTGIEMFTGTANQHATIFSFANTNATQTVTFPDATGTVCLLNSNTPTNGFVPIGNGTDFTPAALTAGTGISISNGSGSITISAGGAAAISFATDSGTATPSGGTITISGSSTGLTTTGSGSTVGLTGLLKLANGGTNANLTASNGGIFYSTATAGAILSGTATAGQLLLSGSSAAPTWSTTTYPSTNAINTLLYASSANVMAALATANSAVLVTNSSGVPAWSGTMTNGQLIIGSTSGTPTAATLTAGVGITITNSTGSITITAAGAGNWVDETGSSVTMATNTGYTSDDGASLVTFTLPTSSAIGDFVEITGKGSGGWKIAQASGQQIFASTANTTLGATGSLASAHQYDCVRLRCLTANTIWVVVSQQSAGLTYV